MKTSQDRAAQQIVLPSSLEEAALVPAEICAATGGVSGSWWHEEVRAGRAPAPAVRQPRFTRWRLSDVRKFWLDFAARGGADTAGAQAVMANATKASAAAKAKRQQQAAKAATA